jgi:hypothetical protein
MQTAFREGVIKEVEELKGIKDVEEDLDIETVNLDEPEEKRKIALIPGGFKPPHRGHVALVTHYLDEVAPSGKVILFMGSGGATPRTIHGKAITYEDALEIWKIYLNNENIAFPNEILEVREVKGGPIGAVIDYVTEADPDKEVIYLGAGEKDAERWKFMMDNPKYNPNNVKVFIEPVPNYNDKEGAPMSATNFRKAIENGEEELIKSYMPESSHDSYREIMDVFEGRLKEDQQPLGIFLRLIEETIDEATVGEMFGFASGNLSNITPGGFEVESEEEEDVEEVEEEPTAKDALEAMLDAIKKVAEENGIEVGEDEELEEMSAMGGGAVEGPGMCANDKKKETLIREVEDYLLSTLGDIL